MSQETFDTAELLEAILLELPMKDLLLSQKVCKQWKAMVDSSIRVQRKLFMAPAEASDPSIPGDFIDPKDIVERLKSVRADKAFMKQLPKHGFKLNPLIVIGLGGDGKYVYLSPSHLPTAKTASCRHMFISQPPLPLRNWRVSIAIEEEVTLDEYDTTGRKLGEIVGKVKPYLRPEWKTKFYLWCCTWNVSEDPGKGAQE